MAETGAPPRGSWREVLMASLPLGLSSFGGPIAHLGYLERSYVQRRGWLSSEEYAGIVALCQWLPGPTSSQVGFLIGRERAGWAGAVAAWVGFTLPSVLIMYGCALALKPQLHGRWLEVLLHGLKLTAVAVVGQALWSMAKNLCPDARRVVIAALGAATLLTVGNKLQLGVLAGAAVAGWIVCRHVTLAPVSQPAGVSARTAWTALAAFTALLFGLPLAAAASGNALLDVAGIFYRSGALVFGGGHVVLPLLRQSLVPAGWLGDGDFLAGYGAAQALPGPLFSFAAYAGALSAVGAGQSALYAAVAVVSIFLPGMLAAVAGTFFWRRLGGMPAARAAMAGVNAGVVGILAAALYDPVMVGAISHSALRGGIDAAIALAGFLMLQKWRAPPLLVVAFCVLAAMATQPAA
jgi:chromate transporter